MSIREVLIVGKIQRQRFPKPIRTMTDEKLLEPDFFRNKRSLPAVGIFDEPTRCYEINQEWAKIVMGWVSWLATVSAWEDAQDDDYIGITEILKFLVGNNCGMAFELRQNTTNNCLLEQSLDGGETWTTVFDFSQCVSIVDSSGDVYSQTYVNNFYNNSFQTFQNNIYNYYENNYINNVTDVAPELGYGDGDDPFRDEGLCWAIGEMIDEVCEAAIAYFDDLDASADDLKQSLALAAALIGIIGLAATGVGTPAALALAGQASLWGAGIGIGALIGTDLFNHFTSTNRSAYEDLAAREELQCCLLDEMKGSNVNRDSFFTDLTLCTGLSTNAQAIADAVETIFSTNAGYAAFTEKNRIGFNSAKAGLLPACPCADPNLAYYVDFTTGNADLWDIDAGTLTGGTGIVSVVSGQPEAIVLNIKSNFAWQCNRFELIYERESDGSFLDDVRVIGWTDVDAGSGRIDVYEHDEPAYTRQEVTLCVDTTSGALRNDWAFYMRDNNAGATIILKSIRIWGNGGLPIDIPPNAPEGC